MKKELVFALKRPFENLNTFIIGLIISSIIISLSFVNKVSKNTYVIIIDALIIVFFDLILAGFNIENIHNVLKKKKLPRFDKIEKKLWYGIIQYFISIIYQIPGLTLLFIGIYLSSFNINQAMAFLISGLSLLIIVYFIQMSAIIEYSKKFKLKDAFKLEVFKKGYSKIFVSYVIVGAIISLFLMLALAFSIIGLFIIPWYIGIFQYTFLSLGYKKIKK